MGDADEGFMDVGVGETLHLFFGVIRCSKSVVEHFDIAVKEDGGHHCEGKVCLYVFVGLIVAVHAHICQQIYVA